MSNESSLIRLSESETAKLIGLSAREQVFSLHFGPGWVSVDYKKSPWVLPVLAKMRGVQTNEQ